MCAKIKSKFHPFTIYVNVLNRSRKPKHLETEKKGREEPVSTSERVKMTLSNFLFLGWG